MARPPKQRLFDGQPLPDNLYPDSRKRAGHWRYRKPDGKYRTFKADTAEAIRLATEANKHRDKAVQLQRKIPDRSSLAFHIARFIDWRKSYDPTLEQKASWRNRCGHMQNFGEDFTHTAIGKITLDALRPWWEALTYHQQHARRAEFNKLFNYLASQGLTPSLPYNPFTTADDRPRLMERAKPAVKRQRLRLNAFWAIYNLAPNMGFECLQIAMGASLLTTMRRGDICDIRLDEHITDNRLRKTINKSDAQKRSMGAAHLQWDLTKHPMLQQIINRARELSLQNYRCPYLLSHTPIIRKVGKTKTHFAQVTPDRLTKIFAQVRDATGLFKHLDEDQRPTFHEVRGLASNRLDESGHDIKQVQQLMAHTDERVTRGYQAGHGTQYTDIDISISEEILGGRF